MGNAKAIRTGYAGFFGLAQDHQVRLDALRAASSREAIVKRVST